MSAAAARTCVRCQRPLGEGLFCQYDGTFVLDAEGTVVMAGRGERILSWFVNLVLVFLTLFIGWVIWWFIVAPKGQNPGKAVVGLRVIRTNGDAVTTGGMFVRGLAGILCGLIPLYLDDLWMLWDRDAQTLHDKLVNTVVVKAKGSEKIVETGSIGPLPAGMSAPPAYAPPINLGGSTPATPQTPAAAGWETTEDKLRALDDLKAKGLVTEEEYQARRKSILERF
jgi:uncharacterized RDD family membrane protein YckC